VTYSDVGGCKEQIEKLREVVETPLLHVSWNFAHFHVYLSFASLYVCLPSRRGSTVREGTHESNFSS
jgi:hypothetical protein